MKLAEYYKNIYVRTPVIRNGIFMLTIIFVRVKIGNQSYKRRKGSRNIPQATTARFEYI